MSVRSGRSGCGGRGGVGAAWKRVALRCTEQVIRSIRASWQPAPSAAFERDSAGQRGGHCHAEPLEPRQLLTTVQPVISEFMALNDTFLTDVDGQYSDWIELHNPTPSPVNLDGYFLTDESDFLNKWRLPAVTLPSGGYMLVFASGKDRAVVGGQLHTNFELDGSGEYLALVAPDAATVLSDFGPEFPEQIRDKSYGLSSGGSVPTTLIGYGSPARYLIPTPSTGPSWTNNEFVESGWSNANVGVGFEANAAPLLPNEIEANDSIAGADDARSNFEALQSNLYHMGLKGALSSTADADYFRIGSLTNGDVLTASVSGAVASRGSLTNPRIELYRGSNPASLMLVTSDDNTGPGDDALLFRRTITATDTYYVRVNGVGGSGSYDLGLYLSNSGTAPATGGAVTTETENNDTAAGATDASTSWRAVQYRSRTSGTIGTTADWFRFQLTAGDLVSIDMDALATVESRVRLVNAAGVQIGYDDGTANVTTPGSNDSWLNGFIIPTTGTYYVVVDRATGTQTVNYALNVHLSSATQPPRPVEYAPSISTNLESAMYGVNATAYLRIPFDIDGVDDVDALHLRMKYDDGFVAYLNGVEVARRNAPTGTPGYNAVATDPHSGTLAFEDIDITAFTSALVAGKNTLAIHALNAAAGDPDLLILPELVATRFGEPGEAMYFATATPGQTNIPTALGFVEDTKFSHDRGFYTAPFQLTITTATIGAEIRYTLDGTPPTATTGIPYTGPITIDRTTTLRAAAFRPGFLPSDVDAQTYLFLDDVIRQSPNGQPMPGWPSSWGSNVVDYGMDPEIVNHPSFGGVNGANIKSALTSIPTFSITMDLEDLFDPGNGIYANPFGEGRSWERPASVELIYPSGREGFQTNAGIRIRGGFSRSTSNPKHAFRLFFRDEYGDGKLNFPMFGPDAAQSFEGFDLRTFQNYSWSFQGDSRGIFLRDQLSRDAQLAMGHDAERGDYYHLYINGVYWGLYNSAERTEASYAESYYGGDKDDYDVVKHENTQSVATDGDTGAWLRLWDYASQGLAGNDAYYFIQGRNPDGTVNPALENLVDVENLIDYMLVIYYGGNLDAPISNFMGNNGVNNFYGIRSRVANEGFRFYAHDSEHTYLTHIGAGVNENRTGPYPAGDTPDKMNPQWLFQRMWDNPEFRLKVADHVHKHFFNGGALTPGAITNRFQRRRAEIELAVHAESARWGDSKQSAPLNHSHWLGEINNILNNYIPVRSGIVLEQLRSKSLYPNVAAPAFNQFGGIINPGFKLTMTAAAGATIYYTLDGTDPRLLGGALSPTAQVYTGPIELNETTQVRARARVNGVWSALDDAVFSTNLSTLRFSEIMYRPLPARAHEGVHGAEDFEYLELVNTSNHPMRLLGAEFTTGIEFEFGDVRLQPGERVLVVKNRAAFEARYGTGFNIAGEFGGSLDNAGEQLRIQAATGHSIITFAYDDDWYDHTDGEGYSLVAINPGASASVYPQKSNWRASSQLLGKPGAPDPGYNPGQIAINEVMANDPSGGPDWIEIHNSTDAPADISGWFLSDDVLDRRKYVFPTGTIIPAKGFLVLYEDQHFGRAGNPGVVTPFTIDHFADAVYLTNSDGAGNIAGYREKEDFEGVEPGVSIGRVTKPTGADFAAQLAPTPGAVNSGPRIGPVVINELLYIPAAGKVQFIELRNITDAPVPLYDPANPANTWRFTRGITFDFPQGATIPAKGHALVVPIDPALFRDMYQVHRSVPIFGPYTGDLATSGENIELSRPGVPGTGLGGALPYHAVDRIAYETTTPWPNLIGTTGNSIVRRNGEQYGNDAFNWRTEFSQSSSPGHHNLDSVLPAADVIDVSPDPRAGAVDSITVKFSEIVRGFDLADLQLTRGGTLVPLAGATLTSDDDVSWVLGNLAAITATEGDYTLTVKATGSGIVDLMRRAMFDDASDTFTITGGLGGIIIPGTDGDDIVTLRRSGENILVWINLNTSLPPTQIVPIDVLGTIEVSLLDGNDTLVLNLADGVPLPDDAIIDGGDGNDVVQVVGTAAADAIDIIAASLSIDATTLRWSTFERVLLNLPGSASLHLGDSVRAALARTFRTGDLTIDPNAQLDVAGHALIVDATPETRDVVAQAVHDLVKRARGGDPRWSGPGITDLQIGAGALRGVATMLNPGLGNFGGVTVDANSVLVRTTYDGDANLDGRINADDYFKIDSGFLSQPATPKFADGDFNYDGRINADDYFLIDSAFLGQGQPAAAGDVSATVTSDVALASVESSAVRKRGKAIKRGDADLFQTKRRVAPARRGR